MYQEICPKNIYNFVDAAGESSEISFNLKCLWNNQELR